MADLTPPSSQSNTPLRPSDPDPPSPSASKTPHPLSHSNASGPALSPHPASDDISLESPVTEGSDDELLMDERDLSGDMEMEEGVKEGAGGVEEEEEENDDGEGMEIVDEKAEGEASGPGRGIRSEELGKVVGPSASEVKGKGKGKSKAKRKNKPAGRGATPRGALRAFSKEGDLYEGEIVTRWNAEIGDVCARPPPAKA